MRELEDTIKCPNSIKYQDQISDGFSQRMPVSFAEAS